MAAATSALLVVLSVCLLLITGGFATDGWPVLGGGDRGSALRLPDPGGTGPQSGARPAVAAAGTALPVAGVGSGSLTADGANSAALPLSSREALVPLSPFGGDPLAGPTPPAQGPPRLPGVPGFLSPPLVALLPGLAIAPAPGLVPGPSPAFSGPQPLVASLPDPSAQRPSDGAPQSGRDERRAASSVERRSDRDRPPRGRERRAAHEAPQRRTVAQTAQEPTTRARARQGRGRERTGAPDDRRSQRAERRTERPDDRVQRRPDRVEIPPPRAERRPDRAERPSPRADRPSGRPGRVERIEEPAGRGHDRAERRDGR